MRGIELGDSRGAEGCRVRFHLFWPQKILVRRLDDERMVLVGGKLEEPLVERRQDAELREEVRVRLSLDERDRWSPSRSA